VTASIDVIGGLVLQGGRWADEGNWVWWGPLIPLLWIAFFFTVFWFIARRRWPRELTGVERARDILAERFARGELSADEYRERLDQLGGTR
jgi:putative membrane protein